MQFSECVNDDNDGLNLEVDGYGKDTAVAAAAAAAADDDDDNDDGDDDDDDDDDADDDDDDDEIDSSIWCWLIQLPSLCICYSVLCQSTGRYHMWPCWGIEACQGHWVVNRLLRGCSNAGYICIRLAVVGSYS